MILFPGRSNQHSINCFLHGMLQMSIPYVDTFNLSNNSRIYDFLENASYSVAIYQSYAEEYHFLKHFDNKLLMAP